MLPVVVTCGPGHEPIDAVRRITNFATGEIGALLSAELERHGYRVTCLHGQGSRWKGSNPVEFTTNTDLLEKLRAIDSRERVRAVFHAAALCDFGVAVVEDATGTERHEGKLSSRSGELILRLKPLPKVLPELRSIFPNALIVGWKYEVDGDRASLVQAATRQFSEANTDACVINGPAYGPGFGLIEHPDAPPTHFADKATLCQSLASWLAQHTVPARPGNAWGAQAAGL